jgi:5-methylcytosine-specific restriction endonuclease McrA
MQLSRYPVLLLNADYTPLSMYPLSTISVEKAVKGIYEGTHTLVEEYDKEIRSPSVSMKIPSVVAIKQYVKPTEYVPFNRFNLFLRDRFTCQYCGEKDMRNLTFDHVVPRAKGGKTEWTNIVAACSACNLAKGHGDHMTPRTQPYEPTYKDLLKAQREFPPNYLHETWIDYLYWQSPLEEG